VSSGDKEAIVSPKSDDDKAAPETPPVEGFVAAIQAGNAAEVRRSIAEGRGGSKHEPAAVWAALGALCVRQPEAFEAVSDALDGDFHLISTNRALHVAASFSAVLASELKGRWGWGFWREAAAQAFAKQACGAMAAWIDKTVVRADGAGPLRAALPLLPGLFWIWAPAGLASRAARVAAMPEPEPNLEQWGEAALLRGWGVRAICDALSIGSREALSLAEASLGEAFVLGTRSSKRGGKDRAKEILRHKERAAAAIRLTACQAGASFRKCSAWLRPEDADAAGWAALREARAVEGPGATRRALRIAEALRPMTSGEGLRLFQEACWSVNEPALAWLESEAAMPNPLPREGDHLLLTTMAARTQLAGIPESVRSQWGGGKRGRLENPLGKGGWWWRATFGLGGIDGLARNAVSVGQASAGWRSGAEPESLLREWAALALRGMDEPTRLAVGEAVARQARSLGEEIRLEKDFRPFLAEWVIPALVAEGAGADFTPESRALLGAERCARIEAAQIAKLAGKAGEASESKPSADDAQKTRRDTLRL
jgi:hypothetical protein